MSKKLIESFPFLKSSYDKCSSLNGNLTYVLYEDVLNPYVNGLLKNPEKHEKDLKHVFEFYELMAVSDDEEVRTLLQVALLENIIAYGFYKKAEMYMGPKTKEICQKVLTYLNEPE